MIQNSNKQLINYVKFILLKFKKISVIVIKLNGDITFFRYINSSVALFKVLILIYKE